jgi:ribosomal protein S27AE
VTFEQGVSFQELLATLPELQGLNSDILLSSSSQILSKNSILNSDFDGASISVLIDVLGGKGKKKRKQYTTPKKNKHKHKNVKHRVLSYYAIEKDGKIQRVKKMCLSSTCKGKGIFMANHKDRHYCGKCHVAEFK